MKKRAVSVLLTLCMVLTLLPAGALAAGEEDFTIEDGVLTGYSGSGGDVTIPSSVTSIGDKAFQNCTSLTGVTIPEGVTSIGDSAFWGCTSLTSVTIPEGVTSIGEGAFWGCTSLTSVTISEGVKSIGMFAFRDCTGLTSVTIPEGVTSIGSYMFFGCTNLTSVTIPEGVTSIGNRTFSGCTSLTGVTIPSSVTSIGDWAFQNCSSLTSMTIPSSVTSIGDSAFFDCTNLTSVTIPEGVTSIGDDAFFGCTNLTSVTIPEGVTSIGNRTFSGCTSLTGMTIPSSVTSIGKSAFSSCRSLTSVTIPEGVTSLGKSVFMNCVSLTEVTIPESVTSIGDEAFWYCRSLTSVTIPSSVTSIGYRAFENCTGLTGVTIPEGVTSIGYQAFAECTGLTNVVIPSSVTSIGVSVFENCTSLTVYGYAGSTAETYCENNNITFVPLDEDVTLLTEDMFTLDTYEAAYTGQPITMTITGQDGDKTLAENTDYTVTYEDNTNVGTATITITGKGNYTGEVTINFTITPASLYDLTPTVTGTAKAGQVLTAKLDGVDSKEYTLVWTVGWDEVESKTYTVKPEDSNKTITVRATAVDGGNYTGSTGESAPLTVEKVTVSGGVTISIEYKAVEDGENADVIQEGDTLQATVSAIPASAGEGGSIQWFRNGEEEVVGTWESYTVQYGDTSLRLVYTPDDNYEGTLSATVEVGKKVLTNDIEVERDGDTITIKTQYGLDDVSVVWYRDGVAIEGAEELSYTVTAEDKGKTITFQILPKDLDSYTGGISSSEGIQIPAEVPDKPGGSASAGNGKITVTWTAPADNGAPITGYLIVPEEGEPVELDADARSYTFEGLTNGKTYTIYIMAVNDVGESEKLTLQGKPSGGSGGGSVGGGSGSAGIGASSQKQPISASKTANGEVALSVTSAKWGDIITITVLPDEGYKLDTLEILDKRGKTVAYEAAEEEGKYTFAMPSTEVTVTPTFVKDTDPAGTTPPEDPNSVTQRFSDVRPDAWYRDIIQYVFDKGIMTGVDSDTFSPETACIRGTVVTMLYRLEGEPEEVEGGSFFDVPEDAWYAKGVAWAAANGIVNGFEDASFRPESPVTREQLVVILHRYAAKKGYDVTDRAELTEFFDAENISAYAVDAMGWAKAVGIITGADWGGIDPAGIAIRAEIAAMLMRFCENVAK